MSRPLTLSIAAAVGLLGITAGTWFGVSELVTGSDTSESLADAELFSNLDGETSVGGVEVREHTLDDLSYGGLRRVVAGPTGTLYLATGELVLRADGEGTVVERLSSLSEQEVAGTADGQVAGAGWSMSADRLRVGWLGTDTGDWWDLDVGPIEEVGALAVSGDDFLVTYGEDAVIDLLTGPDDGRRLQRLLGQPGDTGAEVQLAESLGPIAGLVALPDGRIVFVAAPPDPEASSTFGPRTEGSRLYLLEDGAVAPLDVDASVPLDGHHYPETTGTPEWTIGHLAPGPDDHSLIAAGLGPDDDPVISLVDVDSGHVETLAELPRVNTEFEPDNFDPNFNVSAAAVEDDLVFLADGKLWRLEEAFAD